ncbi:Hypothetical protein NTJ_00093 [Nesidiocoris tenuis]|uniref:Uncharacterized protein n=1 Tax=Nesidiocoris tenuis TaxID=355587 RepID=A0ABN7A7P4_9HEMI|nr:Hypothetical protein NTJ_00093 [Nesidiocoris tenuis]
MRDNRWFNWNTGNGPIIYRKPHGRGLRSFRIAATNRSQLAAISLIKIPLLKFGISLLSIPLSATAPPAVRINSIWQGSNQWCRNLLIGGWGTQLANVGLERKPSGYPSSVGAASTNLVGKFTQSVRRIVQDVKDEGTASGLSKEEVIETNERLRAVRVRLEVSYDTAKKALVGLMGKYTESKRTRNVFQRYVMLRTMIKEVIRLESQYWTLVDIPKQEKQETVPAFVLRACSIMEKTQKSGEGVKTAAKLAEEAEKRKELLERLSYMNTAQIEAENTQMTNDLYRLLKKYTGLRNIIRELRTEYLNSKVYPIFPRYTILKDLIKDIMHNPDYMEVCHEVDPV